MTRHRPLLFSLCAATLVAGFAGFAGCAQDGGDKTILITNNQAAPVDMCLLTPTETGPFLSQGIADGNIGVGYTLLPQIKNLTSSNGSTLTSNRTFFAQGFRVVVSSDNPTTQAALVGINSYSIQAGFSVAPDAATFLASVEILPQAVIRPITATLAQFESTQISVSIEVLGTLGGDDVTSNLFNFPIKVCRGCLLIPLGPCDMLDSTFTVTAKGNTCNPGQDLAVQCCSANGGLVCPAIGTKP